MQQFEAKIGHEINIQNLYFHPALKLIISLMSTKSNKTSHHFAKFSKVYSLDSGENNIVLYFHFYSLLFNSLVSLFGWILLRTFSNSLNVVWCQGNLTLHPLVVYLFWCVKMFTKYHIIIKCLSAWLNIDRVATKFHWQNSRIDNSMIFPGSFHDFQGC